MFITIIMIYFYSLNDDKMAYFSIYRVDGKNRKCRQNCKNIIYINHNFAYMMEIKMKTVKEGNHKTHK